MVKTKMGNFQPEIIHIFDDEKFVDSAISIFENIIPRQSKYLVINQTRDNSFLFVKSDLAKPISLSSDDNFRALAKTINTSDGKIVFLHALNTRKQQLVTLLNDVVLKVWFVWGYDLYNHWKPLKYSIYEADTLKFVNRNLSFKSLWLNKLVYEFKLYKLLKFSKTIYKTDYYNIVQKIDFVAPVLRTEMKFILPINPKLKFVPFAYVNLNQILKESINDNTLKAENILVGNSSAQTNNHIEVFKKLAKLDLKNRRVIVPLSYGDKGDYLKLVLEKGKELLGDNFHPVTDFLSLEDYNELILSCGFAFFNHIRQQAVGNIVAMGYLGTKLFFNEKSVALNYFRDAGMKVFTMDKLEDLSNYNLSESEFINNQNVLKAEYSVESVNKKVQTLLATVLKEQEKRLNA